MAVQLAQASNLPFALPVFRPLSLIYNLELPKFPTQDEALPFEALPPGGSFPDIDDPLDMIRPFKYLFELIAKMSGISLQNLVARAAILMKTLSPHEQWSRQAEENMKDWLEAADLKLAYHRLRPQQALSALRHIIAELIDAEKLSIKDAAFLIPLTKGNDRIMSCQLPSLRPTEILLPERDAMGNEEWTNCGAKSYATMPEQIKESDLIVLAELTRLRRNDYDNAFEYRFSMLAHPDMPCWDNISDANSFFPHEHYWYAEKYPNLQMISSPALAIYGNPRVLEIGSQEWLAFNPQLALHLGWQLNNSDIFSWSDSFGFPMVKSFWWQDGSIHQHNGNPDDVCAEGWLVLSTSQAYETIRKAFVPLIRSMAVVRSNRKGEDCVASQQQEIMNFG